MLALLSECDVILRSRSVLGVSKVVWQAGEPLAEPLDPSCAEATPLRLMRCWGHLALPTVPRQDAVENGDVLRR